MKVRAMSKDEDRKAWIQARLRSGQTVEQLSAGYETVAPRNFRSRFDEWTVQEKERLGIDRHQFDKKFHPSDNRGIEGNKHWDESPEDAYIAQIDARGEVTPQYGTKLDNPSEEEIA